MIDGINLWLILFSMVQHCRYTASRLAVRCTAKKLINYRAQERHVWPCSLFIYFYDYWAGSSAHLPRKKGAAMI